MKCTFIHKMANSSQGVYAPIPQSISDSDSDKEIQVDNLRSSYSNRKAQNGIHNNFDRNNLSNGYMVPNHLVNLSKNKKGFSGMSLSRKCCFLFSIAVCFLTIVIFLWVLPCSESGTCPFKISSWENQHDDIEFKGRINVVSSVFKNSHNLALLFERSLNLADSKSGAISILGSNGAVAWYIPQVKPPSQLNCYLIDVNGDGIKDCLLLGKMGLEAIDPISGEIFWHMHSQNNESKTIMAIDFPVILPDLNDDGINEMITVTNGKTYHNELIIVCGKSGVLLSSIVLKHCLEVNCLKCTSDRFIYSCNNSTNSQLYQISLVDIEKSLQNKTFEVISKPTFLNTSKTEQYELGDHRLVVNNTGNCPECQTNIFLYDVNTNKQLWYLSHANAYVMKPMSFIFKSTESNLSSLKGHINGFILKLWQWSSYRPRKKKQLSNTETMSMNKRYVPNTNSTIQVNLISERVVLITFNNTNVHVINASLTQITQLCFPIDDELICQPDLSNQNESLLISDLDNDGSQELISYSSTFVNRTDNWKLVSRMKVIRLEAELPKLYENNDLAVR